MKNKKPQLGLVLSGAAARSAFYLGFIEVLQEARVPIAVIAAQSGASIVAASYAAGTLAELKKDLLAINWPTMRSLLQRSPRSGGLYTLDHVEHFVRERYTKGAHFEELPVRLSFGATNLSTGELVGLALGDVARAIHITSAVPGVFAPVQWGNHYLVDGGLASFMPTELARSAGADVIVGVSVRATKHIFLPSQIKATQVIMRLKERLQQSPILNRVALGRRRFSVFGYGVEHDFILPEAQPDADPKMLRVLWESLQLAARASVRTQAEPAGHGCDLFITEGQGDFGGSVSLSKMEQLYLSGRKTARAQLPAIQKLIQ